MGGNSDINFLYWIPGPGHTQVWYLDDGCSGHMIGYISLLKDLVSEKGPFVTFSDNSKGSTLGYRILSNGSVTFFKVSYVQWLKHNLFSVS